ncbi:phospho-N-acetylmuramoyl-pentapeptide-transferase homolog [Ananas comosus]|uniref:Phospho-N-acetylmuramoyl-pentapeptide- transferase homolog n=1 Tax=Ananas comosus TaxID=4615 RepID=A0A6P5FUY7_ANACO|nr:phospho-N-acetylmuramoyl-pentapeptide-transferase homolog [Ananas comosus]
MSSSPLNPHLLHLGFRRPLLTSPPTFAKRSSIPFLTLCRPGISGRSRHWRRFYTPIRAMDEDSVDFSSFFEEGDEVGGLNDYYVMSSSEEEDSDGVILNPIGDVELPASKSHLEAPDGAFTVVAHRFANIQRGHKRNRTQQGVMNTICLIAFLMMILLFVDGYSWRIIRLPLQPFYLTHPFSISAILSAFAGCLFIPIADFFKIHRIRNKERHIARSFKRSIPTMGGLFFIPIGIIVARSAAGFSSTEVNGAAAITLAFAAIGLLHDVSTFIRNKSYGLPGWIRFLMQIAAGTCFSSWLHSANISTPYSMKWLVPLPPPYGLLCMEKSYPVLTVVCFVAMGTGVNLTDGLDGLAGGVAAVAFIGMAVAALPISPELAIFGASMSGASVGFLLHNRYKASIYMGGIGSLALGGAIAAMSSCTGMFIPVVISSSFFILELFLVILQVPFMISMKQLTGRSRIILRVAPLHYHLKLWGLKEPYIVASAYIVSGVLALFAGYVGLISA